MCGDGESMAVMSDHRSTAKRFPLASAKAQPREGLSKVWTILDIHPNRYFLCRVPDYLRRNGNLHQICDQFCAAMGTEVKKLQPAKISPSYNDFI